jgi:hypothetical protein
MVNAMNGEFIVNIRSVFGNERIYPISESALLIAKLMERKTFNRDDIEIIKKLGFSVSVKAQTI